MPDNKEIQKKCLVGFCNLNTSKQKAHFFLPENLFYFVAKV